MSTESQAKPLTRAADGRWFGGVCMGIARSINAERPPVGWVRGMFVLGGLLGGVGVLAYLACWLIVPGEGESSRRRASGIVVLAQVCAAAVALLTLIVGASLATVFGYGWIVLVIAAVALAAALISWPRTGPAWALLPVAALALPSIGLAASGVRILAQTGSVQVRPMVVADIPRAGYRSGLGTMLVDLRQTVFPSHGTVTLRVRGGVRRTIVALPHNHCVHVIVTYHVHPFALRVADLFSGRSADGLRASLFQQVGSNDRGALYTDPRIGKGPTLNVEYSSSGGRIYVRDYPDAIDPEIQPDWPGYAVSPEPHPDTTGLSKTDAKAEMAAWRARYHDEVRSQQLYDLLVGGPCSRLDLVQ